ncbi:MAG: DnaJ C-terminal domain-containing protein [Myxococcota bacterium]|nr:DnaJ C-terminal domain-containing protein [Myxococcota bacterium]
MTDISADFYKILGVKRGADQNTIRRAYRQLARQYHPDLNPAAADRFKEITAAYDTLGDEKKRALYDEFGEICLKPGFDPVVARHAGLGRGASGGGGGGFGSFEEFFGHLGGSSAGTRPYRGSDRGPEPESTPGSTSSGTRPYEGSQDPSAGWSGSSAGSASGTRPYRGSPGERVEPGTYGSGFEGSASGTRPYQGSGARQSRKDNGGYRPGKHYGNGRGTNTPPQPSPYNSRQTASRQTASGQLTSGQPTSGQPTPDRSFTARPPPASTQRERLYSSAPMPTRGEDIALTVSISLMESLRGGTREVTVERAHADGRRGVEHLRISLKAGVCNGEEVQLRGKGHTGRHGGHSGDLTITIAVEASPHFRREGHDLFIDVPITLQEAILGGPIEVPTPDGPVRVRAPGGSTNGRRLRLRGRGVSVGNGARGDLYLILRPTPPSSTDPEVIRMIAELEKYYPREGVRADLKL